jgi:hypothetical protein
VSKTKPASDGNPSTLIGYAAAYAATAQQFPISVARKEFDTLFRKDEVRKFFGSNMELLMGVRRINFVRLAKQTELDHAHLSRVRAAKANVSFEAALAIAQALKVSLGTMLMKDLQSFCEDAITRADEETAKQQ